MSIKHKIVCVISGGVLSSVHVSPELAGKVEVSLVDFDNMEADGLTGDQRDAKFDESTAGLEEVW